MADDGVAHSDGECYQLGLGIERLADILEVLGEQFSRKIFFVYGGVQHGITAESEAVVLPEQENGFGGAATQVNGQHLVALFGSAVKKWQCHVRLLASTHRCCKPQLLT